MIDQFLLEYDEFHTRVKAVEVYRLYRAWCDQNAYLPMPVFAFAKSMREFGFSRVILSGGIYYERQEGQS